ncbi:phosphate regulon sensor protein PhoR [Halomonas piscis]|uniref:histidine kinase n=1 Tax=Halomonas piscis TaxID=3031727 RepID=A0ABY9Z2D5_9GAMM|nr:phosphate regulon sensor protein PhoR [Halomonas piscis]WNK20368.1 phosphate regulon sensor protein PhoR [Halomonas piscis]
MRPWLYECVYLAGVAALGAGLGSCFSQATAGLALGLGVVLGTHLYWLGYLYHWLTRRADSPRAPGLWGEVFARLPITREENRLNRLEQMRRDFVANVSHELRTPLTVLAGYLETYGDLAEALPPRLGRGIEQMQAQTSRMQNLVNDLLLLSRLEIDQGGDDHAWLCPARLLERIAGETRALSDDRQTITVEGAAPGTELWGSDEELHSAISNLAFNAVRYTPAGSRIVLRWRREAGGGMIEVEDDGEGIEPVHVPRLTERFYRVDKSRSTQSGGTGLGLAIVKHVLLRHEARLEIESRPGEGALFRCAFPPARLGGG